MIPLAARRTSVAAIVLLVCVLVGPAIGARAGTTETSPQTDRYLTTQVGADAHLFDDAGRTVILRGINVVQIGEYFQNDPAQPPRFDLTEQDFADIAALGFDHVRLIVHWSLLEPEMGVRSDAYVAQVQEALGWARAHDLYVVLDMHQDAWGPHIDTPDDEVCAPGFDSAVGWDGAPLWATLTDGAPTCKAMLRELSPAVAAAWQSFYLDRDPGDGTGIQTHLIETWGWFVDALGAHDPVIAGYDPLNEPNSGFAFGAGQTVQLGQFYDATISAIRAAEATGGRPSPAPVFFEPGVEWSAGSITAVPPPGFTDDEAIVFSPHIYAESISPASITQGWDNAETVAATYGATVWSGEWGYFATPASDNDDQLRRFAAAEDGRLLHSAFWDWRQACGDPHNFYPDRTSQTDPSPSLVRYQCPGDVELGIDATFSGMLSRSYPRAVPGTLTGIDSDIDTGALTVTGATDAPGTADLWFPDRGTGEPEVTGGTDIVLARVPSTDRAAGGWRVRLTVDGEYTITGALRGATDDGDGAGSGGGGDDGAAGGGLADTGGGLALLGLGGLAAAGALRRRRR